MKKITLIIILFITVQSKTIFNFSINSNLTNWIIVDDVVMGGRSTGTFEINEEGHGVFKGYVSTENNGGFSSLRYRFNHIKTTRYTTVLLRVKGDGKSYQFRIKTKTSDYHSYIGKFETIKEWQTIEIPLNKMYPSFRGRRLNIPNYSDESIQEIAFLIGNKKSEKFNLEIDRISLK